MENYKNIDLSKIVILEHGLEQFYTKPVKCNNLILMLCKSGEVDVEINYVTYTLKANGFLSTLSCIGEGNGNPLQCSCLENPRDEGAWWAAVYGVAQSRT